MALFAAGNAFVTPGIALRPQAPQAGRGLRGATEAERVAPGGQAAGAPEPVALALLGLAGAGLALGAARASGRSQQRAPRVERRAVGVCPPLADKWDPLNLGSTDAKMDRYTAVEIKHGRISMIACVGYVMPEIFRFPGCESFENGLGAFSSIPFEGIVQLVAFIGAHEVLVKPRAGGMGSFDLGLGTELLDGIDEEELERRQTVERNNGRLAMIAIMGLMVQDGMFGTNPLALLRTDGWWGPAVDYVIQDIPICMGTALCAEATEEPRMSPAIPYLKYPEVLDGWVGGEKGFDPLQVTDALPVYLVREAELKHGRVCMLATLGWIATDLGVRFPGEVFQEVSTVDAHDKMVEAGIMGPFLATIACYEVYSGWLCLEGFEGKIKREAGDFFLGKNFLPKDEDKAKDMKLKELENGRLAMLAFSGICTQAVLTKGTWPFL
eukprot:CAMPEP_0204523906 /NCGR_PEP_ID=MMETSP0661-20131031/7091_1 /ASSEMBLY_ACC=CAM_ASM_000606 /TAXON_ID=109239 /ORGANISM="Alexandrium margalefi, Strain AMGDE01CS-322" /LENGTH=438 /DNA_ID=CAMNT_0051529633 /DNA_START=65 /DNA_END=1381 /DNA_ORIENTATION=+